MSDEKDLIVVEENKPAIAFAPVTSLAEMQAVYQAQKEFVKSIMREDTDYGKFFGVRKNVLLKPGAEKLQTFFGFSTDLEMTESTEDWTGAEHDGEPFFYYKYRCVVSKHGMQIASGEGSCNSWEKKYRFRKMNGQQVKNPNPADGVNTYQKMAQKRAYVGAIIIAANASEYFTQDIEDMKDFIDADFHEVAPTPQKRAPQSSVQKPHQPVQTVQQKFGNRPYTPDKLKARLASIKDTSTDSPVDSRIVAATIDLSFVDAGFNKDDATTARKNVLNYLWDLQTGSTKEMNNKQLHATMKWLEVTGFQKYDDNGEKMVDAEGKPIPQRISDMADNEISLVMGYLSDQRENSAQK